MFILCHPTKNEPRKRTKGPNALWKPATRKPFRYRVTHFFAKTSSFRFCVCKLKKLANTGVSRNALFVKFSLSFSAPYFSKMFCFFTPAARVSFAASDALKTYMFFSSIFVAERQRKGDPRGNVLARFFRHFLPRSKKWHTSTQPRTRAAV